MVTGRRFACPSTTVMTDEVLPCVATAALGTFDQSEQTLVNGTGAQVGGYNRWGDYADLALDPSDGCTFWFTTEAYDAVGYDWRTKIASFSLPGCTGGGTAPTSPSAAPTSSSTPGPAPRASSGSRPASRTGPSRSPAGGATPSPSPCARRTRRRRASAGS